MFLINGGIMRGYSYTIIFSLIISSCNYRLDKTAGATDPNGSLSDKLPISWSTVETKVLSTCFRCHAGNVPPLLNKCELIVSNFSKVMGEVVSGDMPPASQGYPALTSCQQAILKKWQELNFPQESSHTSAELKECSSEVVQPVVPLDKLPPTYANFNERVLQKYCLSCHNKEGADPMASGILLYPYVEMKAKTNLLKGPGSASKLVKILSATDDERMPPPDDGAAGLTADEINFVIRWIDAGAPE